jgi:hypothetical protein
MQAAARKILRKWMHGGASRAFERWLMVARDAKVRRAKSKTLIVRVNHHVAFRVFATWVYYLGHVRIVAVQMLRHQARSIKLVQFCSRLRLFCLHFHFHHYRGYCRRRRSLKFRLHFKSHISLRGHFFAWSSCVIAFKVQRDDEFTITILKSVSNFPLQHNLEQHAAKRLHSSRAAFRKAFELKLIDLQEKARLVTTI